MAGLMFDRHPLPPRKMGALILCPRILTQRYDPPILSPTDEASFQQAGSGWYTLTAEFDARGPASELEAFRRALHEAYVRDPRFNLSIQLDVPAHREVRMTVMLSVAYQKGAFPVPGLLEALTAPARALPPVKL